MLKMAYLPPILIENLVKTCSKGNGMEYGENYENEDMEMCGNVIYCFTGEKKSFKNSIWSDGGDKIFLIPKFWKNHIWNHRSIWSAYL